MRGERAGVRLWRPEDGLGIMGRQVIIAHLKLSGNLSLEWTKPWGTLENCGWKRLETRDYLRNCKKNQPCLLGGRGRQVLFQLLGNTAERVARVCKIPMGIIVPV